MNESENKEQLDDLLSQLQNVYHVEPLCNLTYEETAALIQHMKSMVGSICPKCGSVVRVDAKRCQECDCWLEIIYEVIRKDKDLIVRNKAAYQQRKFMQFINISLIVICLLALGLCILLFHTLGIL